MVKQTYVLVVDDERICLTIAENMVKHFGLSVITAIDGIEAVEKFQTHWQDIACVIMDIQMLRMNGIEAFHQLKRICEDVKVIIASGHLGNTNGLQLEPLQPAGILRKPFNYDDLASLLNDVLDS